MAQPAHARRSSDCRRRSDASVLRPTTSPKRSAPSRSILTRALKVDGVPTVPSRWLQRLHALVAAWGRRMPLRPQQPWLPWARERDAIERFEPADPPEPRPPVAARPRALSVTQIERWIANPYEIFAKHILKLDP